MLSQKISTKKTVTDHLTKLGLVFVPTDITGPAEAATVANAFPSLVVQSTNARFPPQVEELCKSTYEFALEHLPDSLNLLRPENSFDCIGISCTSFSFMVGSERINATVKASCPSARVVNMADSLYKAAHKLGLRRPHLLTPYQTDINVVLKRNLSDAGFDVQRFRGLNDTVCHG